MNNLQDKIRKPIPMAEVERTAGELVRRCTRELNLYRTPLPIPVDVWIEHPLGIRFSQQDLTHLRRDPLEQVLGTADTQAREIKIHSVIPNIRHYWFTCGHELGHIILHSDRTSVFRDGGGERNGKVPREREADRFAAAFLMPAEMFVNVLFHICNSVDFEPTRLMGVTADASEREIDDWKKIILPVVTSRFGVTYRSAVLRLRDIGELQRVSFVPETVIAELLTLPDE